MADTTPIARSPIAPAPPVAIDHGWEISTRRSDAPVTLTDCTPLAKVVVRAATDVGADRLFGVSHGRCTRDAHGTLIVGSGPDAWMLLAPPGTAGSVAERVEVPGDGGLVTVLDDTHGHALMRLTGWAAGGVLEKICAIDLSEPARPNGAAFRTSVARLVTDVVRDDRGGDRSYVLGCERSSGQYLFDVVLDAGIEFGIEVDGFVWPGI